MDYLMEYMPAVGDIIRIGKYSYKLGQIISGFLTQQNDSESEFAVVWRRTDVFLKEEMNFGSEIALMVVMAIMGILSWGLICGIDENMQFFPIGFFGIGMAMIYAIPAIIIPYSHLKDINESSEIEVTGKEFRLVRTEKGKMGIVYWNNYKDSKVLLKPIYSAIEEGFDDSYIVKDEEKYMLYNAELRMFVAEKYDYIIKYKEGLYLFIKGDDVSLINSMGDRVYE